MFQLYGRDPDFEGLITVPSLDKSPRRSKPGNGIRWDFAYLDSTDHDCIYCIHPYFLDESGEPLEKGEALEGTYRAFMFILFEPSVDFHRRYISVGTQFECREGRHACAVGCVTRLIGLSH